MKIKVPHFFTWKKATIIATIAIVGIFAMYVCCDESPDYLPASVKALQDMPGRACWLCDIHGGRFTVDGHYAFYISDCERKDDNRHFLFHNGAAYPGFCRSGEGIIAISPDFLQVAYFADVSESKFDYCYINGQKICRTGEGFAVPAIDLVNNRIAYGQVVGWENAQTKDWKSFTESEKRTWRVYEGKQTFTVNDCDDLSLYYGNSKGPLVMKVEQDLDGDGKCKLLVGDYNTPWYKDIEFLDCDGDGLLTYIAKDGLKAMMIRNGVKEIECDEIELWKDSQSHGYIYTAHAGPRCSVVINGKPQGNYDGVGLYSLGNTERKNCAYVAYVNGLEVVVNNGKEVGKFDKIHYLACANDGGVAYIATNGGRTFAYLNGQVQQIGEPAKKYWTSPDGKRLACKYELEGDGEYVVIDGVRGDTYCSIGDVQFSPDGSHYAYIAYVKEDLKLALRKKVNFLTDMLPGDRFQANIHARNMVILDGKRGLRYERILYVGFRPDNNLVYFPVLNGRLYFACCGWE